VLNHIFERAWPGYPADRAPFWAAWMTYGRFAVVMFIALSGFSLGLGPARSGWRFKSIATYAHRRAWRILPPYWAALGFSLVMTWYVLAQPGWALPNGRSVVVYGLLVQDAFSVGSPNRAFSAMGRLRAGRHGAAHRVDGGQGLHVVEPQSVLARSGLGSSDRLLPRRDRHFAPAARRPFP
jgi:hypothetical protein